MTRIRRWRTDDRLHELERRIAAQQRRLEELERLERQLIVGPGAEYEWECDHCDRGWIVRTGDTLQCTDCGYRQYL